MINSLAISPDGELIASASVDHTARLWSSSTRKPFGLTFSPDGQLVATGSDENLAIFLWDISQESTIMRNVVSPSFVSPASNITSYIDQQSASSDSLSSSSTSNELPDGTEFATEHVGSRDAAAPPSPSLPPRGRSNREIPSSVGTSPAEPPGGIQVPPEAINSRDAAPSPSPSVPSQGTSRPHIAAASASTPALSSPLKSFWKRFSMFNRSAASVDSKRWKLKFPRIGSIMRRKRRNAGSDDLQH
ncbi:hypothetical protein EDD22DRAFT_927350 [Suillus occidentalis]|nr:hypothetical protein EDD22DRAFT_927350 [Suillus occidentalis]